MKRILLKNVPNMRDLGGYLTVNNKSIKDDTIIRTSAIEKIEGNEIDYFIKNNIRTIIDLRSPMEINRKPNVLSLDDRFDYHIVSLRGTEPPAYEEDIPNLYIDIIDDKENILKVFKNILDSKYGIMYGCAGGKDRTGMITMLLLLICGVPDKDIIADYSLSCIYLSELIEDMHRRHPEMPAFVGLSKPEYMEKTLNMFYEKYHSIEDYTEYIGLTKNDLHTLRNKLLNNEKVF